MADGNAVTWDDAGMAERRKKTSTRRDPIRTSTQRKRGVSATIGILPIHAAKSEGRGRPKDPSVGLRRKVGRSRAKLSVEENALILKALSLLETGKMDLVASSSDTNVEMVRDRLHNSPVLLRALKNRLNGRSASTLALLRRICRAYAHTRILTEVRDPTLIRVIEKFCPWEKQFAPEADELRQHGRSLANQKGVSIPGTLGQLLDLLGEDRWLRPGSEKKKVRAKKMSVQAIAERGDVMETLYALETLLTPLISLFRGHDTESTSLEGRDLLERLRRLRAERDFRNLFPEDAWKFILQLRRLTEHPPFALDSGWDRKLMASFCIPNIGYDPNPNFMALVSMLLGNIGDFLSGDLPATAADVFKKERGLFDRIAKALQQTVVKDRETHGFSH